MVCIMANKLSYSSSIKFAGLTDSMTEKKIVILRLIHPKTNIFPDVLDCRRYISTIPAGFRRNFAGEYSYTRRKSHLTSRSDPDRRLIRIANVN